VIISLYESIALNVKHNLKPKPELFNDVNCPSKTNETIKKVCIFRCFLIVYSNYPVDKELQSKWVSVTLENCNI
jgi:hypothetical protein